VTKTSLFGFLNLKLKKSFGDHFEIIPGVDNLVKSKVSSLKYI